MSTTFFTEYLDYQIIIAPMVVLGKIDKNFFRITAKKKNKEFTSVGYQKDLQRKISEMKKFLKAEETAY